MIATEKSLLLAPIVLNKVKQLIKNIVRDQWSIKRDVSYFLCL